MEKSIGILYICTGPYAVFWKDFFHSFEKNFLPDYEKHYYVFTDCAEIENTNKEQRVHCYRIDNQPWPLITLLRFNTFLKAEEGLVKHQYLMFSNANMLCNENVDASEILPDEGKGQQLFFTKHPGYCNVKPWKTPLDRNSKCSAYVPYHVGDTYVIGALFGGKTEAFLEMSRCLSSRILEDLKKGIIAKWHDESHINHYILGREDVRVLSPEYCYPWGFSYEGRRKIVAVSKQDKFDVKSFKGDYEVSSLPLHKRIINRLISMLHPVKLTLLVGRDFLFRRKKAK